MKAAAKKAAGGAGPKGDSKQSIGGKMKSLFGRTPKKPEPDDLPGVDTAMRKGKAQAMRRARLSGKPL